MKIETIKEIKKQIKELKKDLGFYHWVCNKQKYDNCIKEIRRQLNRIEVIKLNEKIKKLDYEGEISDGCHTFDELYEHRIANYILVCRYFKEKGFDVWKTKVHSDGSVWDGWFVLGIGKEKGKQHTYHLPLKYYDLINFVEELNKAPEYDGHNSEKVRSYILDVGLYGLADSK